MYTQLCGSYGDRDCSGIAWAWNPEKSMITRNWKKEKNILITSLHVLQWNLCTNTKKRDIRWQDNDEQCYLHENRNWIKISLLEWCLLSYLGQPNVFRLRQEMFSFICFFLHMTYLVCYHCSLFMAAYVLDQFFHYFKFASQKEHKAFINTNYIWESNHISWLQISARV